MARKMVCEWGMSDKLGPMTFGKKEEAIFLGREIAQHQEYSEQTAVEIDSEVRSIVMSQYERATAIVKSNREALKRIAEALIEYETLEGHEVQDLIEGKPMTREPPSVRMPTRESYDRKTAMGESADADADKEQRRVLGPLAGGEAKA
jgi:cell division protease FtsH